ncbi:MAG: hypothetical protein GYB65_14255 [Chloroflexi bacterium]|nr:hypothetical protein [Chloroflexota bacterium]
MTTITGHLVAEEATWRIPPYAHEMLWMQQGAHAARASGERGEFSLDVPGDGRQALHLVWGTAGGPPLTIWHRPDTAAPFVVGWQGGVCMGGFVERLHALVVRGLELLVAEVEGGLLPPNFRRLPTLVQMQSAPFARQASTEHPVTRNFTYTLIADADSIYAEYLHHALVSELAVDCCARLGPHEGHWHEVVGLPLLIESVTLLAPD